MTTANNQVSEAKCRKVLALIIKQHGLTPKALADGWGPTLVMDFDWTGSGPHPAIVWEGGPYYWPIYAPYGGRTEDGWTLPDVSDQVPAGVFLEADTHFALAIWPD
jgi:hypothetical protein